MRRVFTREIGTGRNSLRHTRREVLAKLSLVTARVMLPKLARGVDSNTSLPSRKNSRFSGKKVSKAVRLSTTSSASTAPKSGSAVAASASFGDGRQAKSTPTRALSSPRAWSLVSEVNGMKETCCRGSTPDTCMAFRAVTKRADE